MKICIVGCRHPFRTKKSQQAMNKKEFLTKPAIKKKRILKTFPLN